MSHKKFFNSLHNCIKNNIKKGRDTVEREKREISLTYTHVPSPITLSHKKNEMSTWPYLPLEQHNNHQHLHIET